MAEVSIYLPDDLYRRALARGLPLSELLQEAVERALRRAETREWVAQMRARPRRCTAVVDTAALIDEVRSEFGT